MQKGFFLALFIALLAAACAAPTTQRPEVDSAAAKAERLEQTKLALKQGLDRAARLTVTMNRLNVAAADFCEGKTRYISGFATHQIGSAKIDQLEAFEAIHPGHANHLIVVAVLPGMGAEKGGLKVGDHVVAVNGEALPPDTQAAARMVGEKIDRAEPSTLSILRAGKPMDISLPVSRACKVPAMYVPKRDLNAFTDGQTVRVYEGMLDFIKTEEELALVMGHELGHVVRGHIEAKQKNAAVGQVIGLILGAAISVGTGVDVTSSIGSLGEGVGGGRYSVDFEAEADYVGLYIMARAGYPIDNAADFWRRMAVANPGAINMASSHPATADRFVALEAATKEIKSKMASGQPLTPNEAEKGKSADTDSARPSIIQQN
ncbi:MAG: M48 family metalloprotease [Rhodospirillales bacterium]|jgi:hypothetical protein